MRRFWIICLLVAVAGCGASQSAPTATTGAPTPTPPAIAGAAVTPATDLPSATIRPTDLPSATIRPTDKPQPTRTPAPSPSPVPTKTVAPSITASPAQLDTPALNDSNAPPTAKPVPPPNPASDPNQPVRLVIGGVGIDESPVSVGLDGNNIPIVPKHDVGWYNLSAEPGQGENVVFWGHVLRWRDSPGVPAPFANLKDATPGTPLTIYTADGSAYNYVVSEQVWATPDQVQYILPVGSERVTLVSCIGDKVVRDGSVELTHRLITIAKPAN